VSKILNKIKEARTPDRFSQDYLETVLGFSGGGARPFIPLAKRIGLVGSDGTPTDLYHRFRNPAQSEQAMNDAVRIGYDELFKRNQYAYALDRAGLEGLVVEITGLEKSSGTLKAIINTFEALRSFANFELSPDTPEKPDTPPITLPERQPPPVGNFPTQGIGFSYTIYVNLPESTDVAVFNAIFKSMKENLLS
jgi:hypothetical protein